jgi:hypothetical protein
MCPEPVHVNIIVAVFIFRVGIVALWHERDRVVVSAGIVDVHVNGDTFGVFLNLYRTPSLSLWSSFASSPSVACGNATRASPQVFRAAARDTAEDGKGEANVLLWTARTCDYSYTFLRRLAQREEGGVIRKHAARPTISACSPTRSCCAVDKIADAVESGPRFGFAGDIRCVNC